MKNKQSPFNIALVEDQAQFRDFIAAQFKGHLKKLKLDVYASAEEFLQDYIPYHYDLVLVDLMLKDMGGEDLIRTIASQFNEYKCVVVSNILSDEQILGSLEAGAIGYLHKSEMGSLVETIQIFREGGSVISPSIALRVLKSFHEKVPEGWENLTAREKQVLKELTNGNSPEEIATTFQSSIYTVRTQIRSIYKKLQVNSRMELMKKVSYKDLA